MVNRVVQPQEIEVFYVLPALRRELTLCMKELGKTQKEIAKLLGVTEPAISQYVKSKRASKVKFEANMLAAIKEAAPKITDELALFREMQRLMHKARLDKVVCRVHEQIGGVPPGCGVCFDEKK